MISKNLDTKICDYYQSDIPNTQTFREYITKSEQEFGMETADIDNMSEEVLEDYLDELDYLWTK